MRVVALRAKGEPRDKPHPWWRRRMVQQHGAAQITFPSSFFVGRRFKNIA